MKDIDFRFKENFDKFRHERFYRGAILTAIYTDYNISRLNKSISFIRKNLLKSTYHFIVDDQEIGSGRLLAYSISNLETIPIEFVKQNYFWHYTRNTFAKYLEHWHSTSENDLILHFFIVEEVTDELYKLERLALEGSLSYLRLPEKEKMRGQIPREKGETFFTKP